MKELIERRRRQILVHSFLYYQMNENVITDSTFDQWSKELVALQRDFPELCKECVYHDAFSSFDGSSGYDLPYHMPEIQRNGMRLLEYHNKHKSD